VDHLVRVLAHEVGSRRITGQRIGAGGGMF
jgi:hypothetical protein